MEAILLVIFKFFVRNVTGVNSIKLAGSKGISMTEIIAKKPSDCSRDELDKFENLVKKGGEVTGEGLRNRIMQAEWLVFLYALAGAWSLRSTPLGPDLRLLLFSSPKPTQRKTHVRNKKTTSLGGLQCLDRELLSLRSPLQGAKSLSWKLY